MGAARTLPEQIHDVAEALPRSEQERVLAFARSLVAGHLPTGTSSAALLRFAGALPRATVAEMERALEDCERVP
jgi:hypothetical protein